MSAVKKIWKLDIKQIKQKDFCQKRLWFINYINKNIYDKSLENQNTTLIVSRERILDDSYNQFQTTFDLDLKKAMQIFFIDEVAQDTGGVYREWYTNIIKEIFSYERLFFSLNRNKYGKTSYYICDKVSKQHIDDNEKYYEFIGKIIAKAIFDKIILEVDLNIVLLKQILDLPITLEDIKFLDSEVIF